MDTYMHKTMASVASWEKIEIIRSQELMASEARQKFLKKMIILGPKTAILGPQFCRILVLGPHFWWSGGPRPPGSPGSTPEYPHATFYWKPLSLVNFKSLAGWLSRLANQTTDVQLIVFLCKKSRHDIHFNVISKICIVVI